MKCKQKSDNPKQTSTEDSQSPVWKQQELNWDSTANSQENTKLEQAGQKHTSINPKTNKPYYYKDSPEAAKKRARRNALKNMFVNGKYVPVTHPLHKPGRYQSFGDAAFSSLKNYETAKEGQVYIIVNPAFPGWCKVGMAVDAEDRLKQYQTSSPYRDYELIKTYDTDDRRTAEKAAHELLAQSHERKGEWFYIQHPVATEILEEYFNENN